MPQPSRDAGVRHPDTRSAVTLLHATGYLCLRAGNRKRALALLLIAQRVAPDDPALLRALAGAFIANDAPRQAIGAIERLARIEGRTPDGVGVLLAHALWSAGDVVAARTMFRQYLASRKIA
ncbi:MULTISPECIES: hypothetical protein [unclassified Sphingobium]|uniref:hypothetical protein n=1 Tax=unclassified Sphingobium TaxID=2611147 RepID=UPI0035A69882